MIADLMDEVVVAKLKERDVTHTAEPALENCEVCDQPMSEGCIGWCAGCGGEEGSVTERQAYADFFAWGGWRRAFGEYTDEDLECAKGRTTCGFSVPGA